jgi:catechol 2,3-dioxygenase
MMHQRRTFHTLEPVDTKLEFCATMETRPRLFHHLEAYRGAGVQRLDHAQILAPQVGDCVTFYAGTGIPVEQQHARDTPVGRGKCGRGLSARPS